MERVTRVMPSPAFVIAVLALAAALAGTAVAGDQAASTSLSKKKAKKVAKKVAKKQVNKKFPLDPGDLADAAITTPKLADGAVDGSKVQDGSLTTTDLGFPAGLAGVTRTNAFEPAPGGFATVASNTIRLVDGGGGILSGQVQVEDDIADQQPTKVDLRILVDGAIIGPMYTETVASGATEVVGIVGPDMLDAGQHTIALQVRLDSKATISNRSLTEQILPFLPAV